MGDEEEYILPVKKKRKRTKTEFFILMLGILVLLGVLATHLISPLLKINGSRLNVLSRVFIETTPLTLSFATIIGALKYNCKYDRVDEEKYELVHFINACIYGVIYMLGACVLILLLQLLSALIVVILLSGYSTFYLWKYMR